MHPTARCASNTLNTHLCPWKRPSPTRSRLPTPCNTSTTSSLSIATSSRTTCCSAPKTRSGSAISASPCSRTASTRTGQAKSTSRAPSSTPLPNNYRAIHSAAATSTPWASSSTNGSPANGPSPAPLPKLPASTSSTSRPPCAAKACTSLAKSSASSSNPWKKTPVVASPPFANLPHPWLTPAPTISTKLAALPPKNRPSSPLPYPNQSIHKRASSHPHPTPPRKSTPANTNPPTTNYSNSWKNSLAPNANSNPLSPSPLKPARKHRDRELWGCRAGASCLSPVAPFTNIPRKPKITHPPFLHHPARASAVLPSRSASRTAPQASPAQTTP